MDIASLNTALGAVTITGVPLADRINAERSQAAPESEKPSEKPVRATDSVDFSKSGLAALAKEAAAAAVAEEERVGENKSSTGSLAERIAAAAKDSESKSASSKTASGTTVAEANQLSEAESGQVRELRARDREVRAHETAHKSAAGSLAKGGPTYETQKGPDGASYAVGGEVQISLRSGNTPEESLRLANQARRAALAPAQPSGQDRSVASQATQMATAARSDISADRNQQSEELQAGASGTLGAEAVSGPGGESQDAAASDVGIASVENGAREAAIAGTIAERTRPGETMPDRRAQERRTRAYGQVAQAVTVSNLLGDLLG